MSDLGMRRSSPARTRTRSTPTSTLLSHRVAYRSHITGLHTDRHVWRRPSNCSPRSQSDKVAACTPVVVVVTHFSAIAFTRSPAVLQRMRSLPVTLRTVTSPGGSVSSDPAIHLSSSNPLPLRPPRAAANLVLLYLLPDPTHVQGSSNTSYVFPLSLAVVCRPVRRWTFGITCPAPSVSASFNPSATRSHFRSVK